MKTACKTYSLICIITRSKCIRKIVFHLLFFYFSHVLYFVAKIIICVLVQDSAGEPTTHCGFHGNSGSVRVCGL